MITKLAVAQVLRVSTVVLFSAIAVFAPVRSIAQSAECQVQELVRQQEAVAVFRRLHLEIGTLMQAQSEAILEVDHDVVISSLDDGGFLGPTGFLGKRMDKGQSEIKSILIAGRRLGMDDKAVARMDEIEANADDIIAVGHEMVTLLGDGQTKQATALYARSSVPAQVAAFGAAYTMSSGLERKAKVMSLKCR